MSDRGGGDSLAQQMVDAQAARIDKALAFHPKVVGVMVTYCSMCEAPWPCPTRRALTEDVTP